MKFKVLQIVVATQMTNENVLLINQFKAIFMRLTIGSTVDASEVRQACASISHWRDNCYGVTETSIEAGVGIARIYGRKKNINKIDITI